MMMMMMMMMDNTGSIMNDTLLHIFGNTDTGMLSLRSRHTDTIKFLK
jgi:hypothetical protein